MPNYRYNMPERGYGAPYRCRPQAAPSPTPRASHRQVSVSETPLEDLPIAMAYVPWQTWHGVCDAAKGLCCGTMFKELEKPFRGIGGGC